MTIWCILQVSVPDAPDHELIVEWENGPHKQKLHANLQTGHFEVTATDLQPPHHRRTVQYTLEEMLEEDQQVKAQTSKNKTSFRDA